MTVRRNLEFPLRMAKHTKDEIHRRVTKTAELLGLMDLLNRKPRQLSGGQRQRVAMGRAVVREPCVSLMDEPLSNLDAKLRVQIRTEIAALQKRLGTTTIYVTHDQAEAMTLGKRVTVLRDGILQQVAPPQDLYSNPANIFVASFLGNPGMNLLPAQLTAQGDDELNLHVGDQVLSVPTAELAFQDLPLHVPLLVGIRPEALELNRQEKRLGRLSVRVKTVESLGHEQLIYGQLPNVQNSQNSALQTLEYDTTQLVARLPIGISVCPGSVLTLRINYKSFYFFNADGTALQRRSIR
jgi:multiple sugar transport system ATP-binding protein